MSIKVLTALNSTDERRIAFHLPTPCSRKPHRISFISTELYRNSLRLSSAQREVEALEACVSNANGGVSSGYVGVTVDGTLAACSDFNGQSLLCAATSETH